MGRQLYRHWIGSPLLLSLQLLLPLILISTTLTTTTFGFLLPRFGGFGNPHSLARIVRYSSHSPRNTASAKISSGSRSPRLVGDRTTITSAMGSNSKKRPLSATASEGDQAAEEVPLYLEEGLFAVYKPLGWTSQDVVGKLRFLLESDARARKAPDKRTKRRRPWMKVGHGGTLDPLATGVLVCGVGSGTKNLQKYLVGSKAYRAEVTLGYQTTTLDGDPKGSVVEEKAFDHVTSLKTIDDVLQSKFTGKIQQIPPVFSALKRDGKKLYELGRKGQTAEDLKIEPREVTIYDLKLVGYDNNDYKNNNNEEPQPKPIQKFLIDVECGGGTYIRSLVRDIGIALGTVATMTKLERTKQGQFLLEHSLSYKDNSNDEDDGVKRDDEGNILIDKREDCNWTIDSINEAIQKCRETVLNIEDDGLRGD